MGIDWLGYGQGVKALVHQSELGGWETPNEFWSDTSALRRVEARVIDIRGPQAGTVSVNGLEAFFVPARAEVEKGRDKNAVVSGYLAFSLDGARLWDVERMRV
jgi:hypothetical protein